MPLCTVCDLDIPPGNRTCFMCGTSLDEMAAPPPVRSKPQPAAAPTPTAMPMELPAGGRFCPVCVKTYGPEYTDDFCTCGTELLNEAPTVALEDVPMAPMLEDIPSATILDEVPAGQEVDVSLVTSMPAPEEVSEPGMKVRASKPPPGTACLVLYGPDKQPLQYFPLTKDTTLIGRLDAVAGNFPDIDLDEWFDRATIRKISRQHALILRSRATKTFALRPLVGNTGTQLEGDMVAPQQDYPLKPGQRIILGGVIRLKFEIT